MTFKRLFINHQSYLLFLLCSLIIPDNLAFSQNQPVDTIDIIEKLLEKQDTIVRQGKWTRKFDQPLDSVLFRNNNSRIKKEFYNLITRGGNDTVKKVPSSNIALATMDGKTIRKIDFKSLDIFAPSITDTGYKATSWFERTINVAHIDTRKRILERYLLFNSNDKLDVFEVSENERLLRSLPYILDARFIPVRVAGSLDSVDLLLYTQDKFPVGLELNFQNSDFLIGASYQNIFGFGHQLVTTTYWDTENKPRFGYRFTYRLDNLARSFISGNLDYINKWNQKTFLIDFSRNFRSFTFKNAGGASFENTSLIKNIDLLDTTLSNVSLDYSSIDFWLGHIFPLTYYNTQMRSGLFLTARLKQYQNMKPVGTDDAFLFDYKDHSLFLISTGITRQGFRKDNMIYTYGKTEDVPYGFRINLTSGLEWVQSVRRPYLAAAASYGTYLKNTSYVFGIIHLGTYFNNGPEQGAFKMQLQYFSALYYHNRFQYRNFINFSFIHGINRLDGEYTTLANQGGIMGLTSPFLRGNDKAVLNLESVWFSPYVLLGFRFAFFGGLDLGLVKRQENNFANSRFFSGLSVGIRMRNERLVFDTFVLKFAFYPGMPADATGSNFVVGSLPRVRFNDFFPDEPGILNLQ
jgi:hypothetical protein